MGIFLKFICLVLWVSNRFTWLFQYIEAIAQLFTKFSLLSIAIFGSIGKIIQRQKLVFRN